jgi:hypothetical protein
MTSRLSTSLTRETLAPRTRTGKEESSRAKENIMLNQLIEGKESTEGS